MEGGVGEDIATPLHTVKQLAFTWLNRAFALVYTFAISALLYHHALTLRFSAASFFMLTADLILAFMWAATTSFRVRPVLRQLFPENLERVLRREDFPAMDIFICTADPYKEPPMGVVNTALSLMAYDYPPEKISVYVSDDGGSQLTLFAFMEAAKFGKYWLPFCRDNKVMDRCPEVFFGSNCVRSTKSEEIKEMYEQMKVRVEGVVERGGVGDECGTTHPAPLQVFGQWTKEFSRQQHPSVIQVLLRSGEDKDIDGVPMPNLVYISREKSRTTPHHFKAGALNALLRVSAVMTNAPVILTQDCDMYSNDPKTPYRMLCYFLDPSARPGLAYVQFPQRYHGLNEPDIYASAFQRLYIANPVGMDGLSGPSYVGSGCFFRRRAFFGGPNLMVEPTTTELSPDHVTEKPIDSEQILALAHVVAGCNFEDNTSWGSRLGFRYGSLVEDYYTGFRLQCEGWKSTFCHPTRPAFLGDVPITLNDVLSQTKRWSVGLLEVVFSKHNPITFGVSEMGPWMGLCYAHYAFWPMWAIPIAIYSVVPQVALLRGVSIFPKATDPWIAVYAFLFLGAYVQDLFDFIFFGGTLRRWWNDQRMWVIRGLSSYLFATIEYAMKRAGMATQGFSVTSKVLEDDQMKRYQNGVFEFGVTSPMFLPATAASILNFIALFVGLGRIHGGSDAAGLLAQLFLAGFGVLNSLPIYEAVVFRRDNGSMPKKTTFLSTLVVCALVTAINFK